MHTIPHDNWRAIQHFCVTLHKQARTHTVTIMALFAVRYCCCCSCSLSPHYHKVNGDCSFNLRWIRHMGCIWDMNLSFSAPATSARFVMKRSHFKKSQQLSEDAISHLFFLWCIQNCCIWMQFLYVFYSLNYGAWWCKMGVSTSCIWGRKV